VDSKTAPPLERAAMANGFADNTWAQIHEELGRSEREFDELESWFRGLHGPRLPLSRLRLHDILLWCRVTGEDAEARQLGQELLERCFK
jgi:hypothetical protein